MNGLNFVLGELVSDFEIFAFKHLNFRNLFYSFARH